MIGHRDLVQVLGPALVLAAVGIVGSMGFVDPALEVEFRSALVSVAIVVSLYVFVGNSGVISFGHVSFVAVGAFAAGVMTIPVELKPTITPGLFSLLGDHSVGNAASLVLAAAVGGAFALLVGIPLMRLSGLAAGIATFAVLGVTYNILNNWTKIGPGPLTLTTVPETTGLLQATVGAVVVVVVAFAYQRSRFGRKLRAAREDSAAARAAGIDVRRERLWAFALSGALSGFAGGLFVHLAGTLQARDVYLDLTFLTLAMLVVGGVGSLWGAVVGALAVSALDSFLLRAESGEIGVVNDLLGKPLWGGSRLVGVAIFMAVVLVLLPNGLTRGREFKLPRLGRWRRGGGPQEAAA
ncbi:MAG TPA: branched-chain amino acid ABC transporter permease [Gaiellaceae bacterium]|nr:branched-chain amino acid ABC transporter permease [Gaiellaceae bacterium]